MTFTCPPNGVWGAMGCTGPSKCVDASDDQASPLDAAMDAGADAAADAPGDGSREAPSDAVSEADEASRD
jgi:hypothetical protein